ncbi:MAG: replication-associated recombination protein A [Ignavibacteria bacterium]|nr:replication-associated recombination protein A [Ignavibacteria bacterium]
MSDNVLLPPLAERVRPRELKDFKGQEHLMETGRPIQVMLASGKISSFLLWGPPGTGKTTIARLIADHTASDFHQLNAVSAGVKDVREVIKLAEESRAAGKRTILFIDEIHRFNKAQQDALLGAVEAGQIILIGATTENPSFEIIPALRSRMRTFVLNSLGEEELSGILQHALQDDVVLRELPLNITDDTYLMYLAGGDARIMLNLLEASVDFLTAQQNRGNFELTKEILETVAQRKNTLYDKAGEEHYNIISAFIKSIRGSDPDAALYWLARMLEGGEDPLFIARRLVILAAEDIGNASPNGLVLAEAAFSAVHKIGMPEARIILAQCVTYLAGAPKSNAAYLAIDKAIRDVRQSPQHAVPLHLRNAPTGLMKNLGYGKQYKYPHDFEGHFVEENYLPEEMGDRQYYFPTNLGQEKNILDRLQQLWKKKKKY